MKNRQKKTNLTIVDIARELNIAHSTVSRALADDPRISKATKDKICTFAKEMGYTRNFLASGLRTGQTKIIELLYYTGASHLSEDPLLLLILDTLQNELEIQDYRIMLNILRFDQAVSEKVMLKKGVCDGAFVVCSMAIPPECEKQLDKSRCVIIDNVIPGYTSVNLHIDHSLQILFKELISTGSQNIVALSPDFEHWHSIKHKITSYKKMCHKFNNYLTDLGVIPITEGENPLLKIKQLKSKPDTVICLLGSELDSIVDFAERNNVRIPDDLKITALIDLENHSGKYNKVPRIVMDWPELLHQSVLTLLELISGERNTPKQILIKSPLIKVNS